MLKPSRTAGSARARRALVVVGVAGAAAIATAGPALAATTAGTDLVSNGAFTAPGTNGMSPTNWVTTPVGVETAPFSSASDTEYNASGTYHAPSIPPGGTAATFTVEDFYRAGSSTGVEGYGGRQSASAFTNGTITQADDPQVSYQFLESAAPATSAASWAGSALEVDFTSGGASYVLRYFNPWTPASGAYTSAPTSDGTTKYVTGAAVTSGGWNTLPTTDLNSDIKNQFGLASYAVTGVEYENLENTTNAAGPSYPNMTGYYSAIALNEGAPAASLPEAPLAVGLPLVGLLGIGGVMVRRRRRTA